MDQNIIGLVFKTSGYPDQVALSGGHGNQVNFKISISKKCPNFAIQLCFHGNHGNHSSNFKIFSVPLAWPNILTF